MSTAELNQSVVWNTADKYLRSIVEPEDYGDYILPLTVLRRLECILAPTKDKVVDLATKLNAEGMSEAYLDWEVQSQFGLSFYNTSQLDLTRIAETDDHVFDSLMDYVGAFSQSVRDIWDAFDFAVKMRTLDQAGRLWPVVKHFSTIDMFRRHYQTHRWVTCSSTSCTARLTPRARLRVPSTPRVTQFDSWWTFSLNPTTLA